MLKLFRVTLLITFVFSGFVMDTVVSKSAQLQTSTIITDEIKTQRKQLEQEVVSINPDDKESAIIAKDGQYVKYKNGIVYDKNTDLEWVAGPDRDTNENRAKSWVNNLDINGGRWRMPSKSELKGLYKRGEGKRNMTSLLETTGWFVWSSVEKGLSFRTGTSPWGRYGSNCRAFAVRTRK